MHDTASALGRQFFEVYLGVQPARILDVGSRDVNGTLRVHAPAGSIYTGVDIEAGPGVDIVLQDPYSLPFEENTFDAVVSTSCFEHDPMFWLTFSEMVRVTKQQGHIYVNAPSNGSYHTYPFDNWRFYPDSGKALVAWAGRHGRPIVLVESFIARRQGDVWNDCVMVFCRGDAADASVTRRIADAFPESYNIRRSGDDEVTNLSVLTEDMILIRQAEAGAAACAREAEKLGAQLAAQHELSDRLEAQIRESAAVEYRLQGDVLRLKKTADKLKQQCRETATALAAAQDETAAQRHLLAESEEAAAQARQAAEAERVALAEARQEAAALHAELASLRGELAASREVGRAMVAAFRADLAAPPAAAVGPLGRWRRLFRRIGPPHHRPG